MYIVCTFHYIHNCILFASEFVLPLNRTYDVFLLEKGSKLSLVTQEFLTRPQPSFTLDHSTQLFISFTITKISNKNCQKITASQQMKCIVEKLGKAIQKEVSCLPPQVYTILNELDFEMPLCKNDTDSARKAILVWKTYSSLLSDLSHDNTFRLHYLFLKATKTSDVQFCVRMLNTTLPIKSWAKTCD